MYFNCGYTWNFVHTVYNLCKIANVAMLDVLDATEKIEPATDSLF